MMNGLPFGLMLDVMILVMLVVAIIYTVRLTGYLKRFKQSRTELEGTIKTLSKHINKADKALTDLNEAVEVSTYELKDRIDKAMKMADELDIVVQTGDALANRLEQLAVRNRKIIEGGEGDMADLMRKTLHEGEAEPEGKPKRGNKAPSMPAFNIRDPEVERGDASEEDGFTLDDEDILSEAERDLYEKLKSRGGR